MVSVVIQLSGMSRLVVDTRYTFSFTWHGLFSREKIGFACYVCRLCGRTHTYGETLRVIARSSTISYERSGCHPLLSHLSIIFGAGLPVYLILIKESPPVPDTADSHPSFRPSP